MNYLDFFTLKSDATRVAQPKEKQKPLFTSPEYELLYNDYLQKRPWDLVGALNYINRIADLKSQSFSTGLLKTKEEQSLSDYKLKQLGQLSKELQDLQLGLETISEGFNYLSPTYWYNKFHPDKPITSEAGLFVGDVVMDPTTYLSLGTLAAVKAFGKNGTKTAVKHLASKEISKTSSDLVLKASLDFLTQIGKGSSDARKFFASDTYKQTLLHNKAMADRLGWTGFEPGGGNNVVQMPMRPARTEYSPYSKNNATIGLGDHPILDLLIFNTASTTPAVDAYHETLHRGELGYKNRILSKFSGKTQAETDKLENDTKAFLNWKTKLLLLPIDLTPRVSYDYLSTPEELAANLMEVGYRMGIEPGTPYPGDAAFREMLDKFIATPNNDKGGIFNYLRKDKPRRLWDAMTGRYFSIIPVSYSLVNGSNTEQ